jgi:hypothetical protein
LRSVLDFEPAAASLMSSWPLPSPVAGEHLEFQEQESQAVAITNNSAKPG